jgi:menaquinone-specific isochorismate synthase
VGPRRDRPGKHGPEPEGPGQTRSGPDRSRQDRSGLNRSGLNRSGLNRSGLAELDRPPDRLVVNSRPVSDPGDLIGRLPVPAALAWVRHGDGLVGWGEAARLTLPAGEDRFTAAEKWLRALVERAEVTDSVGVPGSGPVAFGSFTFDPRSGGSVLAVPAVLLGRRAGRFWLTTITGGDPPPPAEPVTSPAEVRWSDGTLTAPEWEQAVGAAVGRIRAGQLSKVVLARDIQATASQPVDPRALLDRLARRYPDCYTFSVCGLVGATPELYVRRYGAELSSLVLAGSTPRGASAAEDARLGAALLTSPKNVEEHGYAVADVRGALRPLCERLEVADRPSLLRLANVQHLATAVTGLLAAHPDGWPSALALAAALHPTAAVGGTPAKAALKLIRELEGMDRGRYAGPVGWLDSAGNGEFGIALRCAELSGTRARLFAGCGIVAESDPETELAETQAKFRPVQDALEG